MRAALFVFWLACLLSLAVAQGVPSPWCWARSETVADPATSEPYCRESVGCSRYGAGQSTTLECPGTCPARPVGQDPSYCKRGSVRVPPAGTAGYRKAVTFRDSYGDCKYSYELVDERFETRYQFEQSFGVVGTPPDSKELCCPKRTSAGCGGCPWDLLQKDPRFLWVEPGVKGSLVHNGASVELDWQSFCRRESTGDECPLWDDRIAPYGDIPYSTNFKLLGGNGLAIVSGPGGRFTLVGKTPNGLPACISRDSENCVWLEKEICASRLFETADASTPYLECGERHVQVWNSTGFEDAGHWCRRAVAASPAAFAGLAGRPGFEWMAA
ncbi:hypothetical protein DFJ74DRAFT_672981 [Hyaloraphidium curvatum]|nr:hypothetical protein DFJ74DRAFT_672981 [Hyaloraphidium curvatum]